MMWHYRRLGRGGLRYSLYCIVLLESNVPNLEERLGIQCPLAEPLIDRTSILLYSSNLQPRMSLLYTTAAARSSLLCLTYS